MKKHSSLAIFFLLALVLTGCEDVIDLTTETGPSQLVVDGWLTNEPGPQSIRLSLSGAYFASGPAQPALGAEVEVVDDLSHRFVFTDKDNNGLYEWVPDEEDTLGHVGRTYTLTIRYQGETYRATTAINRVPPIDSLVYQVESLPFTPPNGPKDGFLAEFYARDFVGAGDCYWIKSFSGRQLRSSSPGDITVAFDGSFSPGSQADGILFILPIRQSINVNELFSAGDTVGVELHSITLEAFYFLQQVRQEATNGGIFGTPPNNIVSNIRNTRPTGPLALGYFGASAISRAETVIDPAQAKPKE
ncbi:hypothetical protein GCM10027275_52530 [Rhabdobacter roseus]|uniref:DUF4249 domain-containing protein n=1 Tax=Rhabdobacter roseus TaxID=1655419 RepID=A0A840U4S9_9BACT|nr:DUF4249 domain-containing protein [Rhabdobacter roseus]MBB5287328.1 hypothetical protein [Rhabdobacter roseus]